VREQFCDVGRGVTLCYETFGEPSQPTALLVMGLGTQMIAWHEDFCSLLAGHGLHVVRFDNRDVGHSTHLPGRPPTIPQMLMRSSRAARYDLGDMAQDAARLLDKLQLAPAHVVGASMGGMIAQTLAARYPGSVLSLTSIMSNTGNRRSGQPSLAIYPLLLRRAPRERGAFIEHVVQMFDRIGSPGVAREESDIRALAAESWDRDRDPTGTGRQLAAIMASGDRTAELHRITAPTLVIHGAADRLVAPSGGRGTARAIPSARLMLVPGMGHDLPRALWPMVVEAIAEHVHRAEAVRADSNVAMPDGANASNGARPAGQVDGQRPPLQARPTVPGLQG
jgi:pimeloyl-ACP methyl ester carboxylesterase